MKSGASSSGLHSGIPFIIIADNLSPDQAKATLEMIDDLRAQIWHIYQIQLKELKRKQRRTQLELYLEDIYHTDPPF